MKRITLSMLILLLLSSAMVLVAQEDSGDMAGETAIVYIQEATNGSFIEDEDGVMNLTLEGLADEISFLQSVPALDSGFMPSAMLFTGWGAAEELAASETILRLEDGSITLTLSNPVYDPEAGTVSYTVTVEEADGKKGLALPESFEDATLFVLTDGDFASALEQGMLDAGLRFTGQGD